jgi:hypothetical protein
MVIVLIAYGVLDYFFLSILTARWNFHVMGNTNNKQSAVATPKEQPVAKEILELRQRHQLRPLTNAESGTRTRDLAHGIYGFATCDAQTLSAAPTSSASLEIHKHRDGIAYYVGYASDDHIEKYLTRQKNFHIFASLEPKGKASSLFEIPVDFVSKCKLRSEGDGSQFDLFVTAIPELHTSHGQSPSQLIDAKIKELGEREPRRLAAFVAWSSKRTLEAETLSKTEPAEARSAHYPSIARSAKSTALPLRAASQLI